MRGHSTARDTLLEFVSSAHGGAVTEARGLAAPALSLRAADILTGASFDRWTALGVGIANPSARTSRRTKGGGIGKGGVRNLLHAADFGPAAGPIPRYMGAVGAGRRRENQLRELILYPTLCYPTLSSAPTLAVTGPQERPPP